MAFLLPRKLSTRDRYTPGADGTPQEQEAIQELVRKAKELGANKLGCTQLVQHRIVTNSQPIRQHYYHVSPVIQEKIDQELNEMLPLGVVERSNSAWASPIVIVSKGADKWGFCVDYRKLNSVAVRVRTICLV